MALAKTDRGSFASADNHGTGGYTTASFTPSASSFIVVCAIAEENGGVTDPSGDLTISDSGGLTWTPQGNTGKATSWAAGMRVWTAPDSAGGAKTVTIDCGARNIYKYHAHVFEFTGYDTGSPIGATVVDASVAKTTSDTITLSGSPASTSIVLGFLGAGNTGSGGVTPGTGWAESYDTNLVGEVGLESQSRGSSTSSTVTWNLTWDTTDAVNFAIALEIKEAAAGGTKGMPFRKSGTRTWIRRY